MVPPRLKRGASKYWLRARSGNRHEGKVSVTVDSLYNIFKDNQAVRTRRSDLTTTSTNNAASASAAGPKTQPALRQSARLFNKRAALLLTTRGDDTAEGKANASCSIRRNRSRLFERRAASLLSCRTRRPPTLPYRRTARFKRKRKQMYWLHNIEETSCMGGSKVAERSKHSISESKGLFFLGIILRGYPKSADVVNSLTSDHALENSSEVGIWCVPVIFSLMLGASLRRLQLLRTGLLARCLSNWPELGRLSLAHLFPSLVHLNQWLTLVDGDGDGNNPASFNKARANRSFVLQRLTDLGEEDLLQSILETLPPATLLQAARVCRSWARLCEPAFKAECHRKGWSLPRLPQGATPAFPWRSLYYRHACRACGKVGEFHVRKTLSGNFQFLLCGSCIRLPGVRDRLVQYSIDLYGVTGKLLVPSISTTRQTS